MAFLGKEKGLIIMAAYHTVARLGEAEYMEKRSRFIGHAYSVGSEPEAWGFLMEMRTLYNDASHNVYAFVLGEAMETQKASDDCEPSYSAGRPTLDAIKGFGVSDTIVVTTRYFGGICLGTSGLIRAYQNTANLALEQAGKICKMPAARYSISFDYSYIQTIEHLFNSSKWQIVDRTFLEKVTFIVLVPLLEQDFFKGRLNEICQRDAHYFLLDQESSYISE